MVSEVISLLTLFAIRPFPSTKVVILAGEITEKCIASESNTAKS